MTYMIIVAGGHGTRMGSDIPKQFLKIDGKPILMRTLERFHEYDPEMHLIVVLPKEQQEYWHKLCEEYHFTIPHEIADGGETRFESSKNGLALIPDDAEGLVGFHDGVRPFVSHDTIRRCIEMAEEEYTAIPVACNEHPEAYRPTWRRLQRGPVVVPRGSDSAGLRHHLGGRRSTSPTVHSSPTTPAS